MRIAGGVVSPAAAASPAGAAQEGSERSTMVGELVRSPAPHTWQVNWADGCTGVYKVRGGGGEGFLGFRV